MDSCGISPSGTATIGLEELETVRSNIFLPLCNLICSFIHSPIYVFHNHVVGSCYVPYPVLSTEATRLNIHLASVSSDQGEREVTLAGSLDSIKGSWIIGMEWDPSKKHYSFYSGDTQWCSQGQLWAWLT